GEDLGGLALAYLPSPDGVDLRLTSRGHPADETDELLERASTRVRERVGGRVYADGDTDLAAIVLEQCRARGLTLAVAESCTGGLLGARLTAIAGASDVLLGGVIAYANDVKRDMLDVAERDLVTHG